MTSQPQLPSSIAHAQTLASEHIDALVQRWGDAIQGADFDGVWISAGQSSLHFRDDHGPHFQANAYFTQWLDPQFITPGSKMLIRPGDKPRLFLLQESDFWHAPVPQPEQLDDSYDISTFSSAQDLLSECASTCAPSEKYAHIGEPASHNEQWGETNPAKLLDYLDFHRARKSEYELVLMRIASDIGARGHFAARQAFAQGGSEFDIHMAYLAASQQNEQDLPYGNIVALNQHAAILHYQFQDRAVPDSSRSLLIDAGGNFRGYASDITRTYSNPDADIDGAFSDLLAHMQTHQDELIAGVAAGRTFASLHEQMHRQLGQVLADTGLVTCSGEAAFEQRITETFCPHGLGHLLGLQVHDVGGHLADSAGSEAPPPDRYPSLRFTRATEVDQVFTIEPGLYFIPMLLDELRASSAQLNWKKVDALTPFGGIRIEDNVRVLAQGVENITRDAFSRVKL